MGYCFIPFLMLLVADGFKQIYHGLMSHYRMDIGKVREYSFDLKLHENFKDHGFRRLNKEIC